jgi:amino acid adenylation domain-containing protein
MITNTTELFDKTVSNFPDKRAIIDRTGAYSFYELQTVSKNIALKIIDLQEDAGNPVAVYLPKCKEAIASFIGINYSGNFYVPLDIKSPWKRVEAILQNLKPDIIITDSINSKYLKNRGIVKKLICIDTLIPYTEIEQNLSGTTDVAMIDTDPVYSIFTSGSTGVPKGVLVSHRGVIDYIDWAIETFIIDHNHCIGNQSPFYFDNSTLDIYLMQATGATLVLIPEELFIFPVKLLEYMNLMKIDFIFWVPSVLVSIVSMKLLEKIGLPYLKKILFAGEVMQNKNLNYWRKWMPKALYANLYGPTEITVDCTYYIVDRDFTDSEPLPIGKPCRNTDIIVLNEQNERCEKGEQGELCVRGSSLAYGYLNDTDKTKAAFVQNPLNKSYPEVIYRTGDIVYINERKEIIFIGRKDSQIKHNGYRIELGEIENAILGTGIVNNVCVLYNFKEKQISLFYEGKEIDMGVLRNGLASVLPKYMLPTRSQRLEKLPLNSNGKIDRKLLSAKFFSVEVANTKVI